MLRRAAIVAIALLASGAADAAVVRRVSTRQPFAGENVQIDVALARDEYVNSFRVYLYQGRISAFVNVDDTSSHPPQDERVVTYDLGTFEAGSYVLDVFESTSDARLLYSTPLLVVAAPSIPTLGTTAAATLAAALLAASGVGSARRRLRVQRLDLAAPRVRARGRP